MNLLEKLKGQFRTLSPIKKIVAGYVVIILLGSLLLSLPVATSDGKVTGFMDALFTSASATCVTGLIRFDTFTYWSFFGQLVLLVLIQIGGIGFVAFMMSALSLTHKKIGLASRVTLQNSIAAPQLGGVVRMAKFIILMSASVEAFGTVLLAFYFCPIFGFGQGLWLSLFHSVSAFCNAGFDLMGVVEPFSSMVSLYDNWYVCTVLMLLIIIGGLGFFVWKDLIDSHFRFKILRLQSKIVISVSAFLIIFGAVVLIFTDISGLIFKDFTWSEMIFAALFQSVSARTAGFNSIDFINMTEAGKLFMICLMLIGGSPGSTAGGIKTTTIAVLIAGIYSNFKRKKSPEAFGRRFEDSTIRTASSILLTYLILAVMSAIAISVIDNLSIIDSLFETVSAIATVGLSTITNLQISMPSEIIIIILMIYGRMGSITMLLAFSPDKMTISSKLPVEKVIVG